MAQQKHIINDLPASWSPAGSGREPLLWWIYHRESRFCPNSEHNYRFFSVRNPWPMEYKRENWNTPRAKWLTLGAKASPKHAPEKMSQVMLGYISLSRKTQSECLENVYSFQLSNWLLWSSPLFYMFGLKSLLYCQTGCPQISVTTTRPAAQSPYSIIKCISLI